MIKRLFRRIVEDGEGNERERGATLVLAAATIVVLLGMAGFAVDLGWLYLKTTEAQRAAEASALAGVVYMPNPSSTPWGPGARGYDTAVNIASRNGYSNGGSTGVSPNEVLGKPNQLNVEIKTQVPTFFMRVFGVSQVTFTRDATAERLPSLKLARSGS